MARLKYDGVSLTLKSVNDDLFFKLLDNHIHTGFYSSCVKNLSLSPSLFEFMRLAQNIKNDIENVDYDLSEQLEQIKNIKRLQKIITNAIDTKVLELINLIDDLKDGDE